MTTAPDSGESEFARMLRESANNSPSSTNLSGVLNHEPVSLTVFMRDKAFLNNPPLSDVQYEAVRHIERVYYQDMYDRLALEFESKRPVGSLLVGPYSAWRAERYWGTQLRMINFATLQWGKGSGKDHVARVASMRIAYLLLCLKSPQDYFGMPAQDTIHLLNVASSSQQAQQAFFTPITRAVKTSEFFRSLCHPRQNVISFASNIEMISGHSDAETQEGLNLLLSIADEIDAFKSKKEVQVRKNASAREPTKSAESILKMMRTSGSTRFPETYKNVRISYPRYLGSTIQRLTAESRKDIVENGAESRYYVSGPLATWEVNPRVTGRHAFAGDYKEDPVMARSMYECKPARATNPYFRNHQAVDGCFIPSPMLPVGVTYALEDGARQPVWVPRYEFSDTFFPVRGAAYALHADLAISGDRAGLAMSHVVKYSEHQTFSEDEDGAMHALVESRPHVKVDFVISYTADIGVDPPREIQIRWARQLALELIRRGFNVQRFSFDSFQCLSGDVEIPLLDGTSRKLRELVDAEPFWVYSIQNGHVVPGLCTKAWKTGYRYDMVEVELDNNEVVRTTSDHRFMLRDGTYRQAAQLRPGDSLMPLYRRDRRISKSSGLYEQVWHPEPDGSGQRWRFTHSMVSHYTYGKLPKGWVTHHVNFNECDNTPRNLRQMLSSEHSALHKKIASSSPFAELWADAEWAAAHRLRISAAQSRVQTGKTGKESRRYRHDLTIEVIEKTHRQCLLEGVTPTRAEMERRLNCKQSALYRRVREAGFRSWKAFRDAREVVSEQAMDQRAWKARQKARQQPDNHQVVAVRPAPPEDVFDLHVEEHHNFAIGAGVFVHNSADSMQILEARGIDTERVSPDTSEDPYRSLRDMMYEGRIEIPRPPVPQDRSFLLRDELLSLTRLGNGKIDHPSDGSKDLADALACSVFGAIHIGGSEEESGARATYGAPDIEVGSAFELPYGVNPRQVWERDIPSLY